MKDKNTQLEKEFEIVQWYLKVMEEGVDTKEMLKFYIGAKKTMADLELKHKEQLDKKEADLQYTLN